MQDSERDRLIAEFERLNGPCPQDNGTRPNEYAMWVGARTGWLQAHSDSQMAKDAGRYRKLREVSVAFETGGGLKPIWISGDALDFALDFAIDSAIKDSQP